MPPARAAPRLLECSSAELERTALSRTSLSPQARTANLAAASDCALPNRKPDRYWSAPQAGESPLISGPEIGYLEKPDRYWSAPQAAKSPVISVLEIGHPEKTGQVLVRNSGHGKPGDFSPGNRVCQEV